MGQDYTAAIEADRLPACNPYVPEAPGTLVRQRAGRGMATDVRLRRAFALKADAPPSYDAHLQESPRSSVDHFEYRPVASNPPPSCGVQFQGAPRASVGQFERERLASDLPSCRMIAVETNAPPSYRAHLQGAPSPSFDQTGGLPTPHMIAVEADAPPSYGKHVQGVTFASAGMCGPTDTAFHTNGVYAGRMAPPSYQTHTHRFEAQEAPPPHRNLFEAQKAPPPYSFNHPFEAQEAPPPHQARAQQGSSVLAESTASRQTGSDALFGPAKAVLQRACGQKKDARQSMDNFKEANPVALIARGVCHGARGDREKGKDLCRKGGKNIAKVCEGVVNATPGVGHMKGVVHYARGEKEAARKAIHSATRSAAGFVGAAGGIVAGGPPGAVIGYVAGVNATDAVVSAADTAIHKELRLHGNFEKIKTAAQAPTVGNVFEATLGVGLDVVCGAGVGAGLGETMGEAAAGQNWDSAAGGDTGLEATGDLGTAENGVDVCWTDETGGDGANRAGDAPKLDRCAPGNADEGADVPFVEDEVPFSWKTGRATNDHLSEGFFRGWERMDDLAGALGEAAPDHLKTPDVHDSTIGVNSAERFANLQAAAVNGDGVVCAAMVPDNKRDWIQDIPSRVRFKRR